MKFLKVLIAFLFLYLSLSNLKADTQSRQVVKIGLIFALTGPMSTFSDDIAKAIPILEEKFNSEQSQYTFKLILEDGKFGHSNSAITAAKKLVDIDKVKFIIVGSSGEVMQIADFVERNKILTVVGHASHPEVRYLGDYIFRTYVDSEKGIDLVAKDISDRGIKRVAIFTEETSFTYAIKNLLEKKLKKSIVFSSDFDLADVDFKTLIHKSKLKKPDAYYLNASTPNVFITLLKQLRAYNNDLPIYTYYLPSLEQVQKSLGNQLKGILYLDFPDISNSSEDFLLFQKKFIEINNKPQALFNFKTNYNAIKVVYDGIVAVGYDSQRVKDYLYNYRKESATGLLQFDQYGDVENLNLVLKQYDSNVEK